MRIAFYAPLKHPQHPTPSGDRRMARLLIESLRALGHDVTVASSFRSLDLKGDPDRQARMRNLGGQLARRLLRYYAKHGSAPDIWFTYHLYYKAPDYLGPVVADELNIPYVVAEASEAPKRANGPWDLSYRAARAAMLRADAILTLNPNDHDCLARLVPANRLIALPPFLDAARYDGTPLSRAITRTNLAERYNLDKTQPWLLTVAMMRHGAKLRSYEILGQALRQMAKCPPLLVIGDGAARDAVAAALAGLPVIYLGAIAQIEDLVDYYHACDLFVWPAIDEAYGMALLEAQAAGLPVVAGRVGGVPAIVQDGVTGLLTPPGDAAEFARAVDGLLADAERRAAMSEQAAQKVIHQHDRTVAQQILAQALRAAVLQRARAEAAP